LVLLCVFASLCFVIPLLAQEVLDRVIARVNNQPITLSDARAAVGLGIVAVASGADPIASAARELIDRQLILQEVARFSPPEPPPNILAAEVAALEKNAGTPAQFEALMKSTGLNRARVRELARDTLRIRAYISQRFGPSGGEPGTVQRWVGDLRRRATIVCQLPSGANCGS
jgi:hypothetical protein